MESVAVVTALAYLLLATQERISCWYAAAISTLLYLAIFWRVGLLMESVLQLYYLLMAGYGFWCWRRVQPTGQSRLLISRLRLSWHILAIATISVVSIFTGYLLAHYTEAELPYLDAWTTWSSIFTTWMVTRKLLENWIYWIVIDSVSIYLYWDRELYLTMVLFALYIVIAVFGWYAWLASYRNQAGHKSHDGRQGSTVS